MFSRQLTVFFIFYENRCWWSTCFLLRFPWEEVLCDTYPFKKAEACIWNTPFHMFVNFSLSVCLLVSLISRRMLTPTRTMYTHAHVHNTAKALEADSRTADRTQHPHSPAPSTPALTEHSICCHIALEEGGETPLLLPLRLSVLEDSFAPPPPAPSTHHGCAQPFLGSTWAPRAGTALFEASSAYL